MRVVSRAAIYGLHDAILVPLYRLRETITDTVAHDNIFTGKRLCCTVANNRILPRLQWFTTLPVLSDDEVIIHNARGGLVTPVVIVHRYLRF